MRRKPVKIVFDPSRISYGTLLRVFFSVVHDPKAIESAGAGCGDVVPLGDLSIRVRNRRRLPMRISRNLMPHMCFRRRL